MLNQPRYQGASILLARKNFGCGSSREHAPWALQQYGFRAIIAPRFADIFFNNCFKNGLLPIVLTRVAGRARCSTRLRAFIGYTLTIDLERQVVRRPSGESIRVRGRAVPQVLPARMASTTSRLTLRHADDDQDLRSRAPAEAALARGDDPMRPPRSRSLPAEAAQRASSGSPELR